MKILPSNFGMLHFWSISSMGYQSFGKALFKYLQSMHIRQLSSCFSHDRVGNLGWKDNPQRILTSTNLVTSALIALFLSPTCHLLFCLTMLLRGGMFRLCSMIFWLTPTKYVGSHENTCLYFLRRLSNFSLLKWVM